MKSNHSASALILQQINLSPRTRSALETSIKSAPGRLKEYSKNPSITEITWLEVYQEYGLKDIDIAQNLCDRELTSGQVNWIIAHEKRAKPVIAMLLSNKFDDTQLESILEAKYPWGVYVKMLETIDNKKFQGEMHKLSGSREYLYYLIRGKDKGLHEEESFNQELLKNTLVEAISILTPSRKLSSVLNFAIERYPFIAHDLSDHPSITLRTQIAAYTKIDNEIALTLYRTSEEELEKNADEIYPLYALIANPSTPLESLTYIESKVLNPELRVRAIESIAKKKTNVEEQLKQRIRRASPSEFRPQGRPFELLNLLNETKDTDNYIKVVEAINKLPADNLPISELNLIAPELVPEAEVLEYTEFEASDQTFQNFTEPSSINAEGLRWGMYVEDLTNHNSTLVKLLESELGSNASRWEIFFNMVDESNQPIDKVIRIAATI